MTLTKGQRELRAALLIQHEHACWYCGRHAEQIDWNGKNNGVCICNWCVSKLQWAFRRGFPRTSTLDQKKHYLRTARILHDYKGVQQRPAFTTSDDKSRFPVISPKTTRITPLRQKLLDKRKQRVG